LVYTKGNFSNTKKIISKTIFVIDLIKKNRWLWQLIVWCLHNFSERFLSLCFSPIIELWKVNVALDFNQISWKLPYSTLNSSKSKSCQRFLIFVLVFVLWWLVSNYAKKFAL